MAAAKTVVRPNSTARIELRKRQITERAAALLRSHGYFGLSVDDLCTALKINKTTFYRYFPSKEQLLFELHERSMDQLNDMVEKVLAPEHGCVDKLSAVIRAQILLQQSPGMASLTTPQLTAFSTRHRKTVLKRRDAHEAVYRDLIEQGMSEGMFRIGDSRLQTRLVLGLVQSLQNWYRVKGPLSPDDVATEVITLVFIGLGRETGSS